MTPKLPGWIVIFLFRGSTCPTFLQYGRKEDAIDAAETLQSKLGNTIIAVCPASDLVKLDARKEREG